MQLCPSCGFQNRDTSRFCSQCAAPLTQATPTLCSRCGTQNMPGSRFCANCATPLTSTPAAVLSMTGLLAPSAMLQSRYVITRKLGQGGMGAVYQAQDARLQGKLWAIKEMSDTQIADPAERANAIASFRREAQLLATLEHPNLPKVVDFFDEAGKHYLVMDFIDGQTLEQIVMAAPGFLPEPTVLAWAEQLCDVLDYLHTRQPPIIFRDLKPANIMLARDGKIKLIDFGIVRFFQMGKTKDTAAFGTAGYAAPEQFGTGQTDARSDIFSLGVTLHFLLTKYEPSLSPFNLPPAHNINVQVSTQTSSVIEKATNPSSFQRFQNAREMRQSLFTLAHVPPPTLPRTQQPSTPSQPPLSQSFPSPHAPYIFAPGKTARTVQELVGFCEQDWDRAVTQFYAGYIEQWLKSMNEFGCASDAKKIIDSCPTSMVEKGMGLQNWIEGTGFGNTKPQLAITPRNVNVDLERIDLPSNAPYQLDKIQITNKGTGFLGVEFKVKEPWLAIAQEKIGCLSNETANVPLFVDYRKAPNSQTVTAQIAIHSNAGNFSLPVFIRNLGPILDVSPLEMDFGRIPFLQRVYMGPFILSIVNKGRGTLKFSMVTDHDLSWLRVSPPNDAPSSGEFEGNWEIRIWADPLLVPKQKGQYEGIIKINSYGSYVEVRVHITR